MCTLHVVAPVAQVKEVKSELVEKSTRATAFRTLPAASYSASCVLCRRRVGLLTAGFGCSLSCLGWGLCGVPGSRQAAVRVPSQAGGRANH
jgi:hypothetical protein